MRKLPILYILPLLALTFSLVACKKSSTTTRPSATGTIYELLVVMDDAYWNSAEGDSVRSCMAADMPCLPQMEPYFKLSQVSVGQFDNLFKPTRNILIADINPERYTHNKIVYAKDVYSHPQALCRIQSPTREDFLQCISQSGTQIRSWFVRQELERQAKFYKSSQNTAAGDAVLREFGCEMLVPVDYQLILDTTDVVWAVCDKGSMRKDLIIYSYPYTDPQTFTRNYLLQKRDSLMKARVGGVMEGSFVGTEYKHIVPIFTPISVQENAYCAELRGLWKMYNGAAMGGPFVQHTRLDELHGRVITAEVFIFAPGQKKRNALRQSEAILYTLRLPQELNSLPEVTVTK